MDPIPTRAEALPLYRSPFGAQTYVLPLAGLLGVMGTLLLLVVSANLSNLVLARGLARRGEMAVRRALDADSPPAVPRIDGALRFRRRRPHAVAPGRARPVDRVFGAGRALIFGFLPALRSARASPAAVIKDEAHVLSGRRGGLRSALVVSQVAVAVLLLVGAGLAVRTLMVAQ